LQVDFRANMYSRLRIAVHRNASSTEILLDDIRILPHRCETSGNCDFENGMCGWFNYHSIIALDGTSVLWLRVKPNGQFLGQRAMSYDHTTRGQEGNYLALSREMRKYH